MMEFEENTVFVCTNTNTNSNTNTNTITNTLTNSKHRNSSCVSNMRTDSSSPKELTRQLHTSISVIDVNVVPEKNQNSNPNPTHKSIQSDESSIDPNDFMEELKDHNQQQ